jgi:hypothetical protein
MAYVQIYVYTENQISGVQDLSWAKKKLATNEKSKYKIFFFNTQKENKCQCL